MSGRRAEVSLLAVSYRSEADLAGLVESFRREASREAVAAEIVVVDHSESPDAVAPEGVDRWIPAPNRGYAAGVNRAASAASGGVLLAANPDLRFLDGSLAPLLRALEGGWDIVGPRFELEDFVFPPSDEQTPAAELLRAASTLHPVLRRRWLRRRLREAAQLWEADEPVPRRFLSGALLAFRATTYRRLGPWPEGYFLYFEESEWLLRAGRRGARAAEIPRSRVEHRWGGSTGPTRSDRYETSRRRYFERNFRLAGRLALALGRTAPALRPHERDPGSEGSWWLASPDPAGWPAARWRAAPGGDPLRAGERLLESSGAATGLTLWSWDPEKRAVGSVRPVPVARSAGCAE